MSVFLIPSLMSVYLALSAERDTKYVALPTTLKIFKNTDLHLTSPGRPAKDPEQSRASWKCYLNRGLF